MTSPEYKRLAKTVTAEGTVIGNGGRGRLDTKLARLQARGRRISTELAAFAAASRARLAAIDQEYPDTA